MGKKFSIIVNILDKSCKTDTVQLTKVNCVRVWLHSQYQWEFFFLKKQREWEQVKGL